MSDEKGKENGFDERSLDLGTRAMILRQRGGSVEERAEMVGMVPAS